MPNALQRPHRSGPGFPSFEGLVSLGLLVALLLPAGLPVAAGLGHGLAHLSGELTLDHLLQAPGHFHSHGDGMLHAHEDGAYRPRMAIARAGEHPDTAGTAGTAGTADAPDPVGTAVAHPGTGDAHRHVESPSADPRPGDEPGSHSHHPAVEVLLLAADPGSEAQLGPPPPTAFSPDLHLPGETSAVVLRPPIHGDPPSASPVIPATGAAPALDPPPPRA